MSALPHGACGIESGDGFVGSKAYPPLSQVFHTAQRIYVRASPIAEEEDPSVNAMVF